MGKTKHHKGADLCIESLFRDMGEVVYHWDIERDEIAWINGECKDFGVHDDIVDSTSFQKYINPQDLAERKAALNEISHAGAGEKSELFYRLQTADGHFAEVHETATLVISDDNRSFIYGRIQLQRENKNFERDRLTGLYSRQWFLRQIKEEGHKDEDKRKQETGHVLAIGIDRLSMYNEAFGAHIADEIIRGVSERLQGYFKGHGMVARVCGDVFGVSLFEDNADQVASIVSQLLTSFRTLPIDTEEGQVYVTISVGGVVCNYEDCAQPKDLVVKAESALNDAKQGGRGRYMTYTADDAQREQYRTWLRTSDDLLNALDGNRLLLAFQPVICAKSTKVKFYETLVRMVDKDGQLVAAGQFMPIVEKLGTARLVDQYISQMAVDELKAFPDLTLSINISAWTLDEPTWLRSLLRQLEGAPEVAERLIVEITETVALKDMTRAISFVRTLQALGARVALDDFGTGHTSFKQIKELGVDIVKIDKGFVRRMGSTKDNRLFVQTLQKLAEGCEVETVGEGAETAHEAEMLQKDGVTYIQGYVYGFPSVERLWLEQSDNERTPDQVRALQGSDSQPEAGAVRG